MALAFTDNNFNELVKQGQGLAVVDFWAQWCGPCRSVGPIIEDLAKEYNGRVQIGKLDVDSNPKVSAEFEITSIPAILFFKNGQVVDRVVGAQPKSVLAGKIEELLKS